MAILISGTTNDITINGVSVATDAEVSSVVAPLATTAYVDGKMVLGTAVTASGTAIDFTGIPSWAKKITVMFNGVSTNGSSVVIIQLGDSEGIEATGYIGAGSSLITTGTVVASLQTIGLAIESTGTGWGTNTIRTGITEINKISTYGWVSSSNAGISGSATGTTNGSSSKTLSAALDRIRITTVNGTDSFDSGSINIMYEG